MTDFRLPRAVLYLFISVSLGLLSLTDGPSLAVAADSTSPLAGKRPNIIFIITDDQGYGDISAHGNPIIKTPALDRLFQEGVRFTDFQVSPTCSPTRSAIMTGRHEFKNGVTHTILERERLTLQATTLPQILQSAGYKTGIFGKWHLGDESEYQPNRRGFDEVYIHGGGGIGQIYPGSCGDAPGNTYFDPAILHNGKFVKTKGYCTDLFFRQALTWIDSQRQQEQPFFAYIATNAPHSPLVTRPEDQAMFAGRELGEDAEKFFGMVHNIDQNIGHLLDQLGKWGLTEKTLLVFMNDNGGTVGTRFYNANMRGTKGTVWIGGTRAASFWRWPGTIQPGDCPALAAHLDVLPTLAELAGAKLSAEAQQQVEGRSLVPLLQQPTATWPDRLLFSHLGRWPKSADPNSAKYNMAAVRNKQWALVSERGSSEPAWQLFDLTVDYQQRNDVANQHPDVVQKLSSAFDQWWDQTLPLMVNEKAIGPKINPFQAMYYQQFGGSPTSEDLQRMDPTRAFDFGRPRGKAKKK